MGAILSVLFYEVLGLIVTVYYIKLDLERVMGRLVENSVIGASIVFTVNHLLGHIISFKNLGFPEGELFLEGTIFGMFYNIIAYPIFILINGICYVYIRKKITKWPMYLNVVLLFIIANFFLGRIQLGENFEILYFIRYTFALLSLYSVCYIVEKSSWRIKSLIILLPFLFTGVVILLLTIQ
ncbi:hypothetical protein ACOI1C_04165 [Bacillus sp. DJP31]|uniref:hypothetical protein n=1 Tax=Bacillus sp. DJP31 TaxID=3409789 RepID=UPI003BB533DE